MPFSLPYMLSSSKNKRQELIDYALQDSLFEGIVHDLIDFGYEITFSPFGGAGAYQSHTLMSEPLDTPEKQAAFSRGFWAKAEEGAFKAEIKLSLWLGKGGNCHSFLHELMHFYQDTMGLLLLPLKEQGVMPIMASLRTSVIALLFCEAWAEVEALRACRALKNKGIDDKPWKGALNSPDWGKLARFYDERLAENRGEAQAAASTFEQWYKGENRGYYEFHALEIYEGNFERMSGDIDGASKTNDAIRAHLRGARIPALLKKIPQEVVPKYFELIDLEKPTFNEPHNDMVLGRCNDSKTRFGVIENDALHEIKCASPPYLWKRLRKAEVEASEVPPQTSMGEFQYKN